MGILTDSGGLANAPGTSSVSGLVPETVAHELGHNMDLLHAPCGYAILLDLNYPYPYGTIGAWGYDRLNGMLVNTNTPDLMGYCGPPDWISDYHFTKAMNYRLSQLPNARLAAAFAPSTRSLLLWGGVNEEGELVLEPAFVVDASPVLPQEDGPYLLTGERVDGSVLFTLTFAISKYADAEGGSFAFILPVREEWSENLDRITISGPEGFDSIDGEEGSHYALMRDSVTGEVRGILRDWPDPTDPSTVGRRIPPEPGLEIVVSGGVPREDSW